MSSTVDAVRGHIVESRHRVSAAVTDPDGKLVAFTGESDLVTYWRSCAKPIQVLPLIEDGGADALGIDDAEIALACASHNGEPRHLAVATSLLEKAGCTEEDLACGPHPSLSPAVAREMAERGQKPRKLHSNCSGKHAAMLALARFHGWPTEDYRKPEHPVQRRLLREVATWTGVDEARIGQGVDGCGVVSYAMPLRNMAVAYARLGVGFRVEGVAGENPHTLPSTPYTPAHRVLRAVTAEPFLIAGTGRLCTEILSSSNGTVFAKVGADGVYCAALPQARLGLAMKVEDGDMDAARPALLALLEILAPGAVRVADSFRSPVIRNTLGEEAGHLAAKVSLERT
ncbi:MAG TPA: asparaginase [Gemmatimonadales bacterium]|nr:asparaginase [Gemmatimonadales bacterium]